VLANLAPLFFIQIIVLAAPLVAIGITLAIVLRRDDARPRDLSRSEYKLFD
jgi:hypothetical protein